MITQLKKVLRKPVKAIIKRALARPRGIVSPRKPKSPETLPRGIVSPRKPKSPETLWCTTAFNEYGGYCVPVNAVHRPAAQMVLSNRVHEPDTIRYIREKSGNGDIIHAGTFFGDFLPALSKGISGQSKIWAFEPNKESFQCARITILINYLSNVEIQNAGLGAMSQTLKIQTVSSDGTPLGGASRIVEKEDNGENCFQEASIVAIDDEIPVDRNISILQLDVEGFEKQALTGALRTIQRCLPILILEDLESSDLFESEWFQKNVLSLGYNRSGNLHGNGLFECKKQ